MDEKIIEKISFVVNVLLTLSAIFLVYSFGMLLVAFAWKLFFTALLITAILTIIFFLLGFVA
ncbi:MAG: hypothetical protein JWO50_176 [Candidatus Kaiserbacteria bacterium]|nr:hypothetical protein [Candidatus Kaiserbacteria bacterium]